MLIDKLGMLCIQPPFLHGLLEEEGAGIGGRQGDLDRVRVDFGRKPYGFFDSVLRLARQT